MNTNDFVKQVTSTQIKENISKMFGLKVNLESYSREQLEDMRNKLRTRIFQHEGKLGVNDLLTNETYQKDKAMLDLLNTRIKEMLGEDIKKLRDKLQQLDEAKKGVKAPKYTKKAKGTDQTGDGKSNFDDVQVARMTAGGVPKKKAIAKATSDNFKEGVGEAGDKNRPAAKKKPGETTLPSGAKVGSTKVQGWQSRKADKDAEKDRDLEEAKNKCNHTPKGKNCPVHGLKECGTMEAKEKPSAGMSKAEKSAVVKKAKAGGDIGKPGKSFEKVAKAAGGGEKGKKIAAAAMWKQQAKESQATYRRNVRIVNESLGYLLAEDEEEKANTITAAGDMANDFTSWMQRVGQYQTKVMIELADEIRHNFGAQQAEAFKQVVGPALSATLETLTTQREAISNAIAGLAGGEVPPAPMGAEPAGAMEPPAETPMEPAGPDEMNTPPADEFAAADAATAGREMRESKFSRKLAESHSIISKLAR